MVIKFSNTLTMPYFCDQPHKYWYEHLYNLYYPNSPHNSKHLFDIYTLTHIFWGLLLFIVFKTVLPFFSINIDDFYIIIILFVLTTYFEIHENQKEQIIKYRRIEISESGESSYRGDTFLNFIGDIIGNCIGLYIGYKYIYSHGSIQMGALAILFTIITNVVGLSYWTDFLEFVS